MSRSLADEHPGESTDLNSTFAPLAVATGPILLIAAFATVNRMPGWAADYGASLVYFAIFLYVAIAGRLTWWGADILISHGQEKLTVVHGTVSTNLPTVRPVSPSACAFAASSSGKTPATVGRSAPDSASSASAIIPA